MPINLSLKVLILHFYILFCLCDNKILQITKDSNENFLILATIDGNIHLLNRSSGVIKWSTKLSPFIKTTSTNGSMLIPNPISGQLYIFHQNINNKDIFSPLEHSLFEYVKKTPLFMDNLLLTGSKNDQWLSIDIETGRILHKYQTGNMENCPQNHADLEVNQTMYIGICQYNLVVSDPNSRQIIYNVILNSLATHAVTDLEMYNMRHYASSDSGLVVSKYKTNEIDTGWSVTLDSSLIGLYSITPQGILSRLQFTSMSHSTLSYLFLTNSPWNHNQIALKKALFFGHTPSSWYVMKTFIHRSNKVKSNHHQPIPLITGPTNTSLKYQTSHGSDDVLSPGFYEEPVEKYITHQNRVVFTNFLLDFDKKDTNTALVFPQLINNNNNNNNFSHIPVSSERYSPYTQLMTILMTATFFMVTYIAYFITKQKPNDNKLTDGNSSQLIVERGMTYDAIETRYNNDNDAIVIGDLYYYPKEILGYGTNGTVVFRGVFLGNDRSVAVKRLLKSERSHYELQFLRQSFDCSHLIKCFYITQSREFTFLALELCQCTLEEYVSDEMFRTSCGLDKLTLCKQMMLGVHFLHDKGIVHRDLKPRNVLIMKQNQVQLRSTVKNNNDTNSYQYKIVISDFGLSRQSVDSGLSITKTGCGGTSGYMAPELCRDDVTRISINTDIFSCGILFYYIFTDGRHPFGEEIMSRQHLIHQGNVQLSEELIRDRMLLYFISLMLRPTPDDRPSADEILHGPLFWKSTEKLSFLCDVSDFMEKNDSILLTSLDKRSNQVFLDKWTDVLEQDLIDSLTLQRSYKTKNLSHLTRAFRNKRNHFHELPTDLSKQLFNSNLSGLAVYIDNKYPNLYTTLYEWVRGHLDSFPDSIYHYFPSSVISKSGEFCNSSDDIIEDNIIEPTIDNTDDYLEWRKTKRKRTNHSKKIRGSKNDKKAIS